MKTDFDQYLRDLERERNLPDRILSAVEYAETGGLDNPDTARSPKGAMGRFQFMPATAARFKIDPRDKVQAARGAADYLAANRKLLKSAGIDPSVPNLVASYNAGEGAVLKHKGIPPYKETRGYVDKILDFLVKPAGASDNFQEVTDPALLKELWGENAPTASQPAGASDNFQEVTDPALLASLWGNDQQITEPETEEKKQYDDGVLPTIADAAVGVGMGAGLGWSDEIAGKMAERSMTSEAIPYGMDAFIQPPALPPGTTAKDIGQHAEEAVRNRYKLAKERSPVATTTGEVIGGTAVGAAMPGGTLTNLGRMVGIGALEGGIAGAGYAEPGNRKAGAVQGASIGAVAGPALAGAGKIIGGIFRGLRQQILMMPKADARRLVRMAAERDLIDPGQAKQLLDEVGDGAMLADIGPNLRSAARDAAATPGPGKKLAIDALESRQVNAVADVARAAGLKLDVQDDLNAYVQALDASRKIRAKPLYDEAFKQWIKPTPAINAVLRSDAGEKALAKAMRTMSNEIDLPPLERIAIDENTGEISLRLLDQVKRALFDAEDLARKAANDVGANEARQISNLRRQLTRELDNETLSPAYAQARKIYAGDSALIDAANLGREMFKGRKFATDLEDQIVSLNNGELEAMRIGVLRGIEDVIDSANTNSDIARQLIKNKRTQDLIKLAFRGEEANGRAFLKELEKMSQMKQTMNIVDPNIGSQTSPMAFERISADASLGASNAIQNAMAGNHGPIVAGLLRMISGTPKMTPEIAHEMIKMLTGKNPTGKELASILRGTQAARSAGGAGVRIGTGLSGIAGGLSVSDQSE